MTFRFLSNLLVAMLMAGCGSVNQVETILHSVTDEASLDDALVRVVESSATPSLFVAVVKAGSPVYLRGFGFEDAARVAPVTADSGFNLWSISKVFTSAAVLNLASSRGLSLDSPICEIAPLLGSTYCQSNVEGVETRSLRNLLNHTAGIPDIGMSLYGETQFDNDQIADQRGLAKELLPKPKTWSAPGQDSNYSNSHYLLLAAIVEEITGGSFAKYMRESVLNPLGLQSTGYRYPDSASIMSGSHPVDMTSFFAFFYVDKRSSVAEKQEGRYWFNPLYNSSLGSTGMVTNGGDMSRFMVVMLECLRGRLSDVPEAICSLLADANEVVVTRSPARGVSDLRQKLGWYVYPSARGKSYAHGGAGMGYTSMLQLYPEDELGVFVIANDSYFDGRGGQAMAAVLAGLDW